MDEFKVFNTTMGKLFALHVAQQRALEIMQAEKNKEAVLTTDEILSLIDLAIEMNDREWFMELSERYKALV